MTAYTTAEVARLIRFVRSLKIHPRILRIHAG